MQKNTMLPKARYITETLPGDVSTSDEKNDGYTLQTTKTGIPLVPQPSDDAEDPLVGLYSSA